MSIPAAQPEVPPGVLLRRVTLASTVVAAVLIVVKLGAYVLTGSVAILSSLIDSILDSFASLVNFFAVRQSLVPADADHRFGHGKAEPLAGLGQAAFIAGSSMLLLFEAGTRFITPVPVTHGVIGIAVMIFSLVLTIMLVAYQKYVISQTQSLAVSADSLHYTSDVVLNLSVIVSIVLSVYAGWDAADPLFAIAIAGWIVYAAWGIARQSLDQLMDHELPDADRERIRAICLAHPEVRGVHELRTRASGRDIFIQLHLVLGSGMLLAEAHRIAEGIEAELRTAFPAADVIIHEDPVDDSRPAPPG
ncbi:MAG TPA: cation diffusion facilitator family transporter [Gammaproteobacteria bacterium]|jgi:ferrous-iron efflux pump FieF